MSAMRQSNWCAMYRRGFDAAVMMALVGPVVGGAVFGLMTYVNHIILAAQGQIPGPSVSLINELLLFFFLPLGFALNCSLTASRLVHGCNGSVVRGPPRRNYGPDDMGRDRHSRRHLRRSFWERLPKGVLGDHASFPAAHNMRSSRRAISRWSMGVHSLRTTGPRGSADVRSGSFSTNSARIIGWLMPAFRRIEGSAAAR